MVTVEVEQPAKSCSNKSGYTHVNIQVSTTRNFNGVVMTSSAKHSSNHCIGMDPASKVSSPNSTLL